MKLNLGCGNVIKLGYTNLDVRQLPGVDVVHDLTIPLPFPENSVDEIVASDLLEHFSMSKTNQVLKDWIRVLKVGGLLVIRVPDLMAVSKAIANGDSRISLDNCILRIYGGQDYPTNFHYFGFTKETLTKRLASLGMTNFKVTDVGFNFEITGEKQKLA